jgi:exodeoxyribonuclease VII large subunit
MAMLEKRKKALADEGIFDQDRKQPIPYLPEVIGVITSPSGAVIRDILHRLQDRFPRKVLIWPVAVQGEKCAPEVTAAIEGFNLLQTGGAIPRPDLLIVARGGGSIEDLWGFNEESVVRAAAASTIPLISAVGHETDTTLIDYASDMRAPTPTAAAELSVPVLSDLLAHLAKLDERRARALAGMLQTRRQRVRDLARALPRPVDLVAAQSQRLDHLAARLPGALRAMAQGKRVSLANVSAGLRPGMMRQMLDQKTLHLKSFSNSFSTAARTGIARQRVRLDGLERLRLTLGYKQTLRRGYAVIRDENQSVITKLGAGKKAASLEIEFQDGRLALGQAGGGNPVAEPKRPKPAKKDKGGDQGSLF